MNVPEHFFLSSTERKTFLQDVCRLDKVHIFIIMQKNNNYVLIFNNCVFSISNYTDSNRAYEIKLMNLLQ